MSLHMRKDLVTNSALVFLGGVFNGSTAGIVKHAYAAGFTFDQVIFSQVLCSWLIFGVLLVGFRFWRGSFAACARKDVIKLALSGIVTCLTSILFALALTRLTASVAITLLFQFTWMGVVLEAILTRRMPSRWSIGAAIVIGGGTLLASGLIGSADALGRPDPLGCAFALLAAVFITFLFYVTGNVAPHLPAVQRSFFIMCGALATAFVVCPGVARGLVTGAISPSVLSYGLALGALAMMLPVFLFAVAAPHLPGGLVSIMASSELPAAVLVAVFLLGEEVGPLKYVGIVIILAGVVLAQMQNLRTERAPEG